MKVILINVPTPEIEDDRRQPPGGLISIATYASKHGFDISVHDFAGRPEKEILSQVSDADVYGFSTYTVTYQRVQDLIKELRVRKPDAFFVGGGPHASALPNDVKTDFDCVVCGEGEYAFLDILENLYNGRRIQIKDIIYAEPIANLDDLPFPDFYRFSKVYDYTRHLHQQPAICLDSSRGCDRHCLFCNSIVQARGNWRGRSAESVVAEVKWHVNKGWKAIRFNDDNFLVDKTRAFKLCKLLRPLNIKFRIFARPDSLTPKLCKELSMAGCCHIGIGIESMSPQMLARMRKGTDVTNIREGLQAAHQANILTRGFFICGFPGETDETIEESIQAIPGLALDEAVVYPCIPYPGTDLYQNPDHYGIILIDNDFSNFVQVGNNRSAGFVMRTNQFGRKEVRNWRQRYIEVFDQLGISWSDKKRDVV